MTTLKDRYESLVPDREPYLMRARAFAAITVQSVCLPLGSTPHSKLSPNNTSFGARAAINLASKLTVSLLPPGDSSFALQVPIKKLVASGTLSAPPEILKGLALTEQLINAQIEALAWRRPTYTSLLHLIVAGNISEYMLPDGRIKQFRLEQYVTVRDWSGKVIEVITAEKLKVRSLPSELQPFTDKKEDEDVVLYSQFKYVSDTAYTIRQDLDDATVKAEQQYNGLMPVNCLAWEISPGEHYGRSHVEVNYDDLVALDETAGSLHRCGALAARNLIFVRPNAAGGNLRKRIAQARDGDVIAGNPDDVHPFQFASGAAYATIREEKNDLKRDLAAAFLLSGDLRRDAERVTAVELRMLAQEIESALGGTYSLLSTDLQAWKIRKLIAQMKSRGELPEFGEGDIQINVTTGLEALGKDQRINKVRAFIDLLAAAGSSFKEDVSDHIKFDEVLTPGAVALGFAQAIRSSDEVEQRRADRQQYEQDAAIQQQAAGPMATAMAQGMTQPQA